MDKSVIIIGSGIAAVTAAKAFREIDTESLIWVIGEEKGYPYNRIRLSKGILDKLDPDNLLLKPKLWYEENNIDLITGKKVFDIKPEYKEIILDDGSKLRYDKLLIANGASNRIPTINGIYNEGVYTLRDIDDAITINDRLNKSNEIIIIGGGIQGLETAATLVKHGKAVTVIEVLPRLIPNQLDEKASAILADSVQENGVKIMTNKVVKEILGDGKVAGVLLEGESRLSCDMVIYSIGIDPNIELIEGTNIQAKRGIVVNSKMETNLEDIYAAGDIAEFNDRVVGLWNIAINQGKVAGYNMAGQEATYNHITPVTSLNAFGLSLFSMGCVDKKDADTMLVDEDTESRQYKKVFIRNNRIIGAIVIGDTKKSPLLKKAIENEIVLGEQCVASLTVNQLLENIKSKSK